MVEVKAHSACRTNALTVGELAQRSGVAVSALHFYEKKGLIEGWRTSGNQRRYPRAMLRRVAVIRIAQRAGVPLSVLSDFLVGLQLQRVEGDEWNALAEAWQGLLDERIAALRQLRDDLGRCIGCGCLSLADCPLRNPGDRLGKEGSGARLLPRSSA